MHDTAILEPSTIDVEMDETVSMWTGGMVVRMQSIKMSDEQLLRFCRLNKTLQIEQTARGDLVIMAPEGINSGRREFRLYGPFYAWEERTGGGQCFGPTAGFRLPNGAMRAPDVAWVRQERLDRLTEQERDGFAPICPDFVLELRSRTDRLPRLQKKMVEYIDNGARLGWLIDPLKKQVFIYRPGEPVEHLENPATLSGDPVLVGFTLDVTQVW